MSPPYVPGMDLAGVVDVADTSPADEELVAGLGADIVVPRLPGTAGKTGRPA